MSYKVDESKLIAYLYDELSLEEKTRVEDYLRGNEAARKELEELKEARFLMGRMTDREVEVPKFTFDQAEVVVASAATTHNWWRYPVGIAASITLILTIGYLTSFSLSTGGEGLTIAFGDDTTSEEVYSKDQVEQMIASAMEANNELISQRINASENNLVQQISLKEVPQVDENLLNEYMARLRDFNRETLRTMLENSEQNQKTYTDQSLQDLAVFLDIQRQNDLEVIQTRFENFVDDAAYNQLQTNQILTNLISSVEQPSNQY